MSKCTFSKEEVNYLGHVISKEGVKVDPEKWNQSMNGPNPLTYPIEGDSSG